MKIHQKKQSIGLVQGDGKIVQDLRWTAGNLGARQAVFQC